MELSKGEYFRFKILFFKHIKVFYIIFFSIVPVYGCSVSKVQAPDITILPRHEISKTLPVPPDFYTININKTAQNFTHPYEEDVYGEENLEPLSDDIIYFNKYHEEEVIGFPTLSVYEPKLIGDPLIEDNCVDSAFPWCDPHYEDEYLAYLEHEKAQQYQVAIFPNFVAPVDEGLILRGMQSSRKKRRGHYGLDIIPITGKRSGVPIKAVEGGVVVRISRSRGHGYYTVIYHQNGIFSLYSHTLKKKRMKVGQKVNRGDNIAIMGKSGNARGYHLHFELLDLRESWSFEESIDEFVEKLCQKGKIAHSQRGQFSKLLFAKQAKKDPLPHIPGLVFAKKIRDKWVAVTPASQTKTDTAAAKKK